jgi:hypothetical protein
LRVEMGELRIPVGVAVTLLGLAVSLQAVTRRIEQFTHQGAAHPVALLLQRRSSSITPKALDKFKMQIRVLTRRTRGISLPQLIEDLTPYLIGWRGYFGFCQTPRVLSNVEAWIRRRLRSYLWRQWQNGPNRFKELRRRGVPKFHAAIAAGSPTGFWRMSGHPAVQQALRNHYPHEPPLEQLGVQPIGLCPAMFPRNRHTQGMDHVRLYPARLEPARQPKAVAAGFEGKRNPRDSAAGPDRLIPPAVQHRKQPFRARVQLLARLTLNPDFLVMAHGTAEEVARAKEILGTANHSRLDVHAGVKT